MTVFSEVQPVKVRPDQKAKLQREAEAVGKPLLTYCRDKRTVDGSHIPSFLDKMMPSVPTEPRWEDSY